MSTQAPWIALSISWEDSPQFDGASHGHRLAWIMLLCHAKTHGRGGKVSFTREQFAEMYRLTLTDVDNMLAAALDDEAIELGHDYIHLLNWNKFQRNKGSFGTRPDGLVYFMENETTGEIKIGVSIHPETRRRQIELQEGQPVRLLATTEGSYELERELHGRFSETRTRGEWFTWSPELDALIAAKGGSVGW